jgi:hypothetical protein
MRALPPLVAAFALLLGCGDDPPPPACQMELLAHLAPLPASTNPFHYQYSEVAARDGIAYLGASDGAGVLVLDVTSGETLAVLDRGLGRTINSVAADGNLLAFAPGSAGVVVYDISNPRAPARRAHLAEPVSYCHTVFIHEEIVYCATSSSGDPQVAFLKVTTPADPAAPLQLAPLGRYNAPVTTEEEQLDVLVHDLYVHRRQTAGDARRLAYLAFWERGLQVIDVTDPANPTLVGASPPTPKRWTHSVWVDGDFAYVGEESYKGLLRVFDVSDPATPREVGVMRSAENDAISAHNVHVANGFVYASWYQDGLRVFPARGAADTREVAYFHTWNGADNRENPAPFDVRFSGNWDVFVEGGRIYAADMQTGLWVLRHQPGGETCADRPRGTSAFAKVGRPPIGWSTFQPRRLRPNREFPFLGVVSAVDPYFDLTPAMVQGLNARMGVAGAASSVPATVLDQPDGSTRLVRGVARVYEQVPATGVWVEGELEDEGARRRLRGQIEMLPAPPLNQDFEPNDDVYLAGVVRPQPDGPATFSGSVDAKAGDWRDIYIFQMSGPPASVRLVTPATAGDPEQPAALLVVSKGNPAEQGFGAPTRLPAGGTSAGLQQVVNLPEGEVAQLYVIVTAAVPTDEGAAVSYQLEIDRP